MTAEKGGLAAEIGGLTAAGTIAPPGHMPQLIDGERQTESGKAELTVGKDGTRPGMSPVTSIGIVMTGMAGKKGTEAQTGTLRTSIAVKIGMCPAVEQRGLEMTAGNKTGTGTGEGVLHYHVVLFCCCPRSSMMHVHYVLCIQAWAVVDVLCTSLGCYEFPVHMTTCTRSCML